MVLPPPPPQKPTYVSSSGQLTAPPLSKRLYDAARDVAEMAYLFVDTLVTVSTPRLGAVEMQSRWSRGERRRVESRLP